MEVLDIWWNFCRIGEFSLFLANIYFRELLNTFLKGNVVIFGEISLSQAKFHYFHFRGLLFDVHLNFAYNFH